MPFVIVSGSAIVALLILRYLVLGRIEPLPRLEIAHSQIIGCREIIDDVFEWSARQGKTMLMVADGIGSGTRGRTASMAATDSIVRTFELQGFASNPAYFFKQAFRNANEAVLRYVPDGTAGASVLCALVSDDALYYALAGNCKLAVFRGNELIPIIEGQTLDALARNAFKRNELSRDDVLKVSGERQVYNYVGKDYFREMEMFSVPIKLKPGDCIILMTDGVFDFCPSLDLERILRTRQSCKQKAWAIMDVLNDLDHPEQDNATIVLAKVNKII
jgi:serine/threonine protein phosphatase PrpC